MKKLIPLGGLSVLLLTCTLLAGCGQAQPQSQVPPPQTPEVLVSLPIKQNVTDYELLYGHTDAEYTVEIRARVNGYLDKVYFQDGAEVKKGQLLFQIDPRPYAADMARAQANVVQAEAHLQRLDNDYNRAFNLLPSKAISKEDFDKIAGDRAEAKAAVGVARASREIAKQNLDWTKVTAPITGRISRRLIDPGNMVKADETPLTTIVSEDPMYAYFDVDERTVLRIRRLIREGKILSSRETDVPVMMGLADDDAFPFKGTINFVDNKVDSGTGTLWVRGIFANPKHLLTPGLFARWMPWLDLPALADPKRLLTPGLFAWVRGIFSNRDRLLTPGLFARVRLPIGTSHPAILVAEQALGRDQGQKFVYVVKPAKDKKGEYMAEYRRVQVGRSYDGLAVITDGLKEGEQVVVSGLQSVRPKKPVQPKLIAMPREKPALVSVHVSKPSR